MRRFAGALTAVLAMCGVALAAQDGTDVFVAPGTAPEQSASDLPAPGPAPVPEPTEPEQPASTEQVPSSNPASGKSTGGTQAKVGGTKPVETAKDLTFAEVVGSWTGTVAEINQDPYTINLTLHAGGVGEVSYTGYDCRGVLGPVSQGAKLVFKETIAVGRDICADGTVELSSSGQGLSWVWINEFKEIQATADLTRKP